MTVCTEPAMTASPIVTDPCKDVSVEIPMMEELIEKYYIEDIVVDEDRILCDLEMLCSGAFEPLTGFMTLKEYNGVINDMTLPSGDIFPMPIVFPVPADKLNPIKGRLSTQSTITSFDGSDGEQKEFTRECIIRDTSNAILATITVESIFKPCLTDEQQKVLGTTDDNHPFVAFQNTNYAPKNVLYVGGSVKMSQGGFRHFDFLQYREPANAVRKSLDGVEGPIVGFQTRNPLHRAHFELTCDALRRALEESGSDKATLILTPAMGPTQPGDIAPDIRLRCYKAILPYYQKIYGNEGVQEPRMVILPLAMRMAGPKEALWHAIIRKNYGCTHFIVGRDHAGPSKPSKEGKPFYGPYDAHDIVEKYAEQVGIKPITARMLSYVGEENGGYMTQDKIPAGVEPMNISGTRFREMIQNNEPVPEWFGFPEVVAELKSHYKTGKEMGLVIYLTGLPSSGKSTLACAVDAALRETQGERRLTTILDADIIRTHLSKGLGFSAEDRSMNVRRIGYTASEIAKHGGICIVANIAPFKADRDFNRNLIESKGGNYIEIYVDTSVEVCEQRDVKGLYAKARAGIIKQFTGVNDPYEIPESPEVSVSTTCSLSASLDTVMSYLSAQEFV